jgi:hypothetical protein
MEQDQERIYLMATSLCLESRQQVNLGLDLKCGPISGSRPEKVWILQTLPGLLLSLGFL